MPQLGRTLVLNDIRNQARGAEAATRPRPEGGEDPGERPFFAALQSVAQPQLGRIGDIIGERRKLTPAQIEAVLERQSASRLRFGEAAVLLGYADEADVQFALGRQFRYALPGEAASALSSDLVTLQEPFAAPAERFRSLRAQVTSRVFKAADEVPAALAVLSAQRGDGRTFCAANLAIGLAQLGGRTLLVDADLRRPRLHRLFKVDAAVGLSSVLAGRADGGVIQVVRAVPGLFVLPAGAPAPNPAELVERDSFRECVQELTNRFTHVVVDTPAAEHGGDACAIAWACGAALVVGRRNSSRVESVRSLMAALAASPVRLVGAVMNEF